MLETGYVQIKINVAQGGGTVEPPHKPTAHLAATKEPVEEKIEGMESARTQGLLENAVRPEAIVVPLKNTVGIHQQAFVAGEMMAQQTHLLAIRKRVEFGAMKVKITVNLVALAVGVLCENFEP
mmetsp:Transcript_24587/g.42082  ORF Transcript_24587/g.42082 Transcript_24587/m.42082 type:complete len:124 (+) Transcript_24587:539-910(+)